MAGNPVRNCVGCGQTDDHPRHIATLPDGSDALYHHDCHSRLSPPCSACKVLTDSHSGELTGQELRDHIVANDPIGKWQQQQQQSNATDQVLAQQGVTTNG